MLLWGLIAVVLLLGFGGGFLIAPSPTQTGAGGKCGAGTIMQAVECVANCIKGGSARPTSEVSMGRDTAVAAIPVADKEGQLAVMTPAVPPPPRDSRPVEPAQLPAGMEQGREQPEPTMRVSVQQISRDFVANQLVAEQKYVGKTLSVSGRIDGIEKAGNQYFIYCEGATEVNGVKAYVADSERAKLAAMRVGQAVVFTGKARAFDSFDLEMQDCRLGGAVPGTASSGPAHDEKVPVEVVCEHIGAVVRTQVKQQTGIDPPEQAVAAGVRQCKAEMGPTASRWSSPDAYQSAARCALQANTVDKIDSCGW